MAKPAKGKGKGKGGKGRAKGRQGSTTSAKPAQKTAKKGGKKKSVITAAQRASNIKTRLRLHTAAALLEDFHGGRNPKKGGPIKSGCGRPRGS